MRVLLVNAFPATSGSGRTRYDEFRSHVRRVLLELERQDVTPIDIIERTRHNLDDFLFEMHSTEFANPQCITQFDRLDFVFVVGDTSACVWAPPFRKLVLLAKMCMMTGKCLFASGLGATLIAFLCSTAGETLQIINNRGKGELLDDVQSVPPPAASSTSQGHRTTDVLLNTRTGDFFTFDEITRAWIPHGNTGIVPFSSDHARDYGARINSARAGTKPHNSDRLGHALVVSKRGDTKCCCRLDATRHAVVAALAREILVNCQSSWDLDERINATGANQYRVLVDSARGPMLVEFGNCVGSHFTLAREYDASATFLRNYVVSKYEILQVHEHLDRSYVTAIAGSARLQQRLHLAATKTSVALGSTRTPVVSPEVATTAVTISSGKTSPKRCRPVSAGPSRSSPKSLRTIQTSRSEYPVSQRSSSSRTNNQWDTRDEPRPVRPQTARASLRTPAKEAQPETISPVHNDDDEAFGPLPQPETMTKPIKAHRRIRVAQQNERDKPYCAIEKFTAMQDRELYYSVVNDAPYRSTIDRELLEQQQDKLKWVAGPFHAAVGKASTHMTPEVSIFARVPFDQRNVPEYIIQRRQLDPPSPPPRSSTRTQDKRTQKRPASAAASTRRTQR